MLLPRVTVWMFSFAMMVLGTGMVSGQNYPNKPIRLVTSGVGGGSDFLARQIAQGISGPLGQPVVVDNRPGGVIPGQIVSKAPADGYTLLAFGSPLWIGALLQDMPYDPVRDFSPITLATISPNVVVVHPSVPVKSVKELIALAKAKPGELNYASGPTGGSAHLSAESFKAMAGVNIVRVAYKSASVRMTALLGGEVQIEFSSPGSVASHAKAGKLRALAVTSAQPSALAPGLPTVAASGLPGYESTSMNGVFAPARTPAAVIKRLNEEMVRVLNEPDVKRRFFDSGAEIGGSSPEQFAAAIKSEMTRMAKVIKEAGIRAD